METLADVPAYLSLLLMPRTGKGGRGRANVRNCVRDLLEAGMSKEMVRTILFGVGYKKARISQLIADASNHVAWGMVVPVKM